MVGRTPSVSVATNAQTRKLFEHHANPEQGSLFSALIPAEPFDLASYQSDPQAYLSQAIPSRIWDTLPPGEAPRIGRAGRYLFDVLQGESVVLRAKTDPDMPVTFYSAALGQFDNQLATITVQADHEGFAEVNYRATAGQMGDIDIFAGSPVRSGRTRFLVRVAAPEKAGP